MNDKIYTILYAAVLGTLCSVLLAGASKFCGPIQKENEKAEQTRTILGILGVKFKSDAPASELLALFKDKARTEDFALPASKEKLRVYFLDQEGRTVRVALPIAGPGLWGPIHALIALDPDLDTIRGINFYKQEETPGLGGEITKPWFRKQFVGKRLSDLHFVKNGQAKENNEVDAITAATITCNKVEVILARTAKHAAIMRKAIVNRNGHLTFKP